MNDLDTVAVVHLRIGPILLSDNIFVELDGNSLRRKLEAIQQIANAERSGQVLSSPLIKILIDISM